MHDLNPFGEECVVRNWQHFSNDHSTHHVPFLVVVPIHIDHLVSVDTNWEEPYYLHLGYGGHLAFKALNWTDFANDYYLHVNPISTYCVDSLPFNSLPSNQIYFYYYNIF